MSEPITEDWLCAAGFKWHQHERQTTKHWLLWIGEVIRERNGAMVCYEDLGIEVAHGAWGGPGQSDEWFCWLRSDAAHRYHRFIHLRSLATQDELIAIVEAISGQPWNPDHHIYGSVLGPRAMEAHRRTQARLDVKFRNESAPWYPAEKDASRAGALPDHLNDCIEGKREPR